MTGQVAMAPAASTEEVGRVEFGVHNVCALGGLDDGWGSGDIEEYHCCSNMFFYQAAIGIV